MLSFQDVSFAYPGPDGRRGPRVRVVDGISFNAPRGSITAITGPSGCGKSTLLNLAAGILTPGEGEITYQSDGLESHHFRCGYVFQNPTLIPWRTVEQNARFGCEFADSPRPSVNEEIDEHLRAVGLSEYRNSYPRELSGGMQHRLAFVRMAVSQAPVLLLDEPFSNSDFKIRRELQRRLLEVVRTEQRVALLVSHDLEEMVRVASQIIVIGQRPARIVDVIVVADELHLTSQPHAVKREQLLPYVESLEKAMLSASLE